MKATANIGSTHTGVQILVGPHSSFKGWTLGLLDSDHSIICSLHTHFMIFYLFFLLDSTSPEGTKLTLPGVNFRSVEWESLWGPTWVREGRAVAGGLWERAWDKKFCEKDWDKKVWDCDSASTGNLAQGFAPTIPLETYFDCAGQVGCSLPASSSTFSSPSFSLSSQHTANDSAWFLQQGCFPKSQRWACNLFL